jgi:hypothetical protein
VPPSDWQDLCNVIISIHGNWDDHHGDVRAAMYLAVDHGWVERKPKHEAWRLTPLGLKEFRDIEVEEVIPPREDPSLPFEEVMAALMDAMSISEEAP